MLNSKFEKKSVSLEVKQFWLLVRFYVFFFRNSLFEMTSNEKTPSRVQNFFFIINSRSNKYTFHKLSIHLSSPRKVCDACHRWLFLASPRTKAIAWCRADSDSRCLRCPAGSSYSGRSRLWCRSLLLLEMWSRPTSRCPRFAYGRPVLCACRIAPDPALKCCL